MDALSRTFILTPVIKRFQSQRLEVKTGLTLGFALYQLKSDRGALRNLERGCTHY
ncbi:MAG: hypothetical protein AAGF01_13020 [Cyanobacteria bacterium P01_G01_bin.38]